MDIVWALGVGWGLGLIAAAVVYVFGRWHLRKVGNT